MAELKTFEMIFEIEPECLCGDRGEVCLMVKNKTELVRCRDCKYATMAYDGHCKYCEMLSPNEAAYYDGDFFCAYGERRVDND